MNADLKPIDPPERLGAMTCSAVRDYPQDAPMENGNYQNECYHCGQTFIGHKERVICRACRDERETRWNAMTKEEQEAEVERQKSTIRSFFQNRQNAERIHGGAGQSNQPETPTPLDGASC